MAGLPSRAMVAQETFKYFLTCVVVSVLPHQIMCGIEMILKMTFKIFSPFLFVLLVY